MQPVSQGFNYQPTPTGIKYHDSDEFVKLITGPFGSGKSCAVVNDILFYILSQAPAPDGVRYTRIGVIRGTYPELSKYTRDSLVEVMPEQYGTIRYGGAPITGIYRGPVGDGDGDYSYIQRGEPWQPGMATMFQAEFILQALQTAEDAEKIKSANWSFAWINEATSVDYEEFVATMGRVGRYPSEELGGCTYAGILVDFNQPPPGHYLHRILQEPEHNYAIFRQPPAAFKHVDELGKVTYEVNPDAENLNNLKGGSEYYANQIAAWQLAGRTDKIDSLFCMLDVPVKDGKPVWSEFSYDIHVANKDIEPLPYCITIIGYDTSGIHPAAAFFQENQGRWAITDEIYGDEMGLEEFIEQAMMPLITQKYPTCKFVVSCDPANARDAYTGLAPTTHLEQKGFQVFMPSVNTPKTRIRAVSAMLNRNFGGLIISPHCKMSIYAMQGGYRYPKLRVHGSVEAAYNANPEKNIYSHIADAVQYGAMFINRGVFNEDKDIQGIKRRISKRHRTLRKVV